MESVASITCKEWHYIWSQNLFYVVVKGVLTICEFLFSYTCICTSFSLFSFLAFTRVPLPYREAIHSPKLKYADRPVLRTCNRDSLYDLPVPNKQDHKYCIQNYFFANDVYFAVQYIKINSNHYFKTMSVSQVFCKQRSTS